MPRYKAGAPQPLYLLVINTTGELYAFCTKKGRTNFVVKRTPTYEDGTYTFRTYVQKES